MTHVLVLYASDYGHTKRAADVIAQGAETVPGTSVRSLSVSDATHDDVLDSDALLLGSPVHMGSMHWEIKRFIDETLSGLWTRDLMVGRVGGVFVTGGGLGGGGGGCELTMVSMLAVLAELGMVLVPLPKTSANYKHSGHHWGPYVRCGKSQPGRADLPESALPLLRSHGANVARAARQVARDAQRSAFGYAPNHLDTRSLK